MAVFVFPYRKGSLVIDSILGVVVDEDNEMNVLASPQLLMLAQRISDILRQDLGSDELDGFFLGANPRLVGDVQVHGQGTRAATIDIDVPADGSYCGPTMYILRDVIDNVLQRAMIYCRSISQHTIGLNVGYRFIHIFLYYLVNLKLGL